jgi:hypothetical protein
VGWRHEVIRDDVDDDVQLGMSMEDSNDEPVGARICIAGWTTSTISKEQICSSASIDHHRVDRDFQSAPRSSQEEMHLKGVFFQPKSATIQTASLPLSPRK